MAATLPPSMTLEAASDLITKLTSNDVQSQVAKQKKLKRPFFPSDSPYRPWRHMATKTDCLELLAIAAGIILSCDTGFVLLSTLREMLTSCHGVSSYCLTGSYRLRDTLLWHLPVVMVKMPNGDREHLQLFFAARPVGGVGQLNSMVSMAASLQAAAGKSCKKMCELPIRSYLRALDSEKDRRIMKALIVKLTSQSFVRAAFNWKASSMAQISEEMDLVDVYLGGLHQLLASVDYACTHSDYERRKMRLMAMQSAATSRWMLRKSLGGRPSLIERYSCCLGTVVKSAIMKLEGGGMRAQSRRRDSALYCGVLRMKPQNTRFLASCGKQIPKHDGGRANIKQVTKVVCGTR